MDEEQSFTILAEYRLHENNTWVNMTETINDTVDKYDFDTLFHTPLNQIQYFQDWCEGGQSIVNGIHSVLGNIWIHQTFDCVEIYEKLPKHLLATVLSAVCV